MPPSPFTGILLAALGASLYAAVSAVRPVLIATTSACKPHATTVILLLLLLAESLTFAACAYTAVPTVTLIAGLTAVLTVALSTPAVASFIRRTLGVVPGSPPESSPDPASPSDNACSRNTRDWAGAAASLAGLVAVCAGSPASSDNMASPVAGLGGWWYTAAIAGVSLAILASVWVYGEYHDKVAHIIERDMRAWAFLGGAGLSGAWAVTTLGLVLRGAVGPTSRLWAFVTAGALFVVVAATTVLLVVYLDRAVTLSGYNKQQTLGLFYLVYNAAVLALNLGVVKWSNPWLSAVYMGGVCLSGIGVWLLTFEPEKLPLMQDAVSPQLPAAAAATQGTEHEPLLGERSFYVSSKGHHYKRPSHYTSIVPPPPPSPPRTQPQPAAGRGQPRRGHSYSVSLPSNLQSSSPPPPSSLLVPPSPDTPISFFKPYTTDLPTAHAGRTTLGGGLKLAEEADGGGPGLWVCQGLFVSLGLVVWGRWGRHDDEDEEGEDAERN